MDNIRITSGKFRGRSIKSPGSISTHPMGAREKLALFNMISDYLPEAIVLDAYAGSGALGTEALSRGASYVIFVEKIPRVARQIRDTLAELGVTEFSEVIERSVENFSSDRSFDIVIADPPYDKFDVGSIESLGKFCKNTGVLVLSHPGEAPELDGFALVKTRKYAKAYISVYRKS